MLNGAHTVLLLQMWLDRCYSVVWILGGKIHPYVTYANDNFLNNGCLQGRKPTRVNIASGNMKYDMSSITGKT